LRDNAKKLVDTMTHARTAALSLIKFGTNMYLDNFTHRI